MCDFCEFQKRKIAGIKPHDETKAEKLVEELKAHQDSYRGERNVYNSERDQSKEDRDNYVKGSLRADNCTEHISIDYAQSIDVPHTADQLGGTFYLHMRKFLLFCVCSVLEDQQYCYTYDEREAGKGANEVISFLHNFLANRKIKTSSIRIHADNCAGQNKNKYVLWYLSWLVATGRLKRIEIKFMIKGHTHCIVDGGIGHIKRQLRRSNVFCLEHWKDVIDQSAVTNQAIIVNGNDVYDWKQGLFPYFNELKGISKIQHFAVDSNAPGFIFVKNGFSDKQWRKRKLIKSENYLNIKNFRNLTQQLDVMGFKGGKPDKEKKIFKNLRQYVKSEWKDELCPDPKEFKSPIRDKKTCPDWGEIIL